MVRADIAAGRDARPAQPSVGALIRPATSTVERSAHLAAAAYLMKHRRRSALVVTTDDDARRPIAVITDADMSQVVADRKALEETRTSDLDLPAPVTVEPGSRVRSSLDTRRRVVEGGVAPRDRRPTWPLG